jgi:hypothetical protein
LLIFLDCVQVDGGEWDKFIFAYFAWLVQMGVCFQAILSRLPVGHTHSDIDQKFSVISIHLRGKGTKMPGVRLGRWTGAMLILVDTWLAVL